MHWIGQYRRLVNGLQQINFKASKPLSQNCKLRFADNATKSFLFDQSRTNPNPNPNPHYPIPKNSTVNHTSSTLGSLQLKPNCESMAKQLEIL
jgi:hypothetical protein